MEQRERRTQEEESEPGGETIYSARAGKPELRAFVYELPLTFLAVLAAAFLAIVYLNVVVYYDPHLETRLAAYAMAAIVAICLFFVFWAASYYVKEVRVYPDRIEFNMVFGTREVPFRELESIKELSADELKRTFFRPGFINMTPVASGGVALKKKKGRIWVFSPEDSAEFVEAAQKAVRGDAPDA